MKKYKVTLSKDFINKTKEQGIICSIKLANMEKELCEKIKCEFRKECQK